MKGLVVEQVEREYLTWLTIARFSVEGVFG